MHFRPS